MKDESQAPIRELTIDYRHIAQKLIQSASTDDIIPENLPGIDIKSGLKRMGGNRVLYKKLLVQFYEHYRDSARLIRSYLEQGESEPARQLSHTLKGISGNLAIYEVYHSAIVLETKLRSGDVEKAKPLAIQFETALEKVTEGLRNLYQKAQIDQTDTTGICEENISCKIVFSKIKHRFDELGAFLKENNLESERCLEALVKELQGTEAVSVIRDLKNQIDLFNFDEARKTYEKLKDILKKA